MVSVAPPDTMLLSTTPPVPLRLLIVSVKLPFSSVPPLTVTLELLTSALALPMARMPALTVVPPV